MISSSASIHRDALVDSGASVGAGTRVWAFAHLVSGAVVGADCNICDHTFIEGGVQLGDRVTMKCGVFLWDGVSVEDDVFIGPSATFINDPHPRSRRHLQEHSQTHLLRGCSIGANSTILSVIVGKWAMVGAGAVVTRDVPAYAEVCGNPAKFKAWVCRCGEVLELNDQITATCGCGIDYQLSGNILREINET